eukprot:132013-Pyramimonas_sp.AAC.1
MPTTTTDTRKTNTTRKLQRINRYSQAPEAACYRETATMGGTPMPDQSHDVDQYDEIMAACTDARQKMNDMRLAR